MDSRQAGCGATQRACLAVLLLLSTATLHAQASRDGNTCGHIVGAVKPLGRTPWPTLDPFLFCAYHADAYPAAALGTFGPPQEHLRGRHIGSDFSGQEGWSMYHGETVPGFPQHPHSGFETVTVVLEGLVDHFDSLGGTGRYGAGDAQWMTAGRGVLHSEMFPLVHEGDAANPLELLQLWLNLPQRSKSAAPDSTMFWRESMPVWKSPDGSANVTVIAGAFGSAAPLRPTPNSWAAEDANAVGIWIIWLAPGATVTLPACAAGPSCNRMLYFMRSEAASSVTIDNCNRARLSARHAVQLDSDAVDVRHHTAAAGASEPAVLLLLQGRPIAEPVVNRGPFVATSDAEMQRIVADFRSTGYGGWPWPRDDPHHDRAKARFAQASSSAAPQFPPTASKVASDDMEAPDDL